MRRLSSPSHLCETSHAEPTNDRRLLSHGPLAAKDDEDGGGVGRDGGIWSAGSAAQCPERIECFHITFLIRPLASRDTRHVQFVCSRFPRHVSRMSVCLGTPPAPVLP